MAMPSEIRRLALVLTYQLDVAGEDSVPEQASEIEPSAFEEEGEFELFGEETAFSAGEKSKALALARSAIEAAGEADAIVGGLAPDWPAHRRPAIDRAILRLAYAELRAGEPPRAVVLNEAVELAKAFSTEKS
ncbi:MAG: transcription antitermination factor NusB, partial [Planctomycetota bacterium]